MKDISLGCMPFSQTNSISRDSNHMIDSNVYQTFNQKFVAQTFLGFSHHICEVERAEWKDLYLHSWLDSVSLGLSVSLRQLLESDLDSDSNCLAVASVRNIF